MRLDTFDYQGSRLWDLSHNGVSLITFEKTLVSGMSQEENLVGFFVNDELANDYTPNFPEEKTPKNILLWLCDAGYFTRLQKTVFQLFPLFTPRLLVFFCKKQKSYFYSSLSEMVRAQRNEFENYLQDKEIIDIDAYLKQEEIEAKAQAAIKDITETEV